MAKTFTVEDLQEFKVKREQELEVLKKEREQKQDDIDDAVQAYRQSLEEEFHQEYSQAENILKGQIMTVDLLLSKATETDEVLQ